MQDHVKLFMRAYGKRGGSLEDQLKNPEVLIRKYSDRRLYDPGASRYVKLADIALMVRDGIDVRVVDGRSGKDITRSIFTQIIVENAREREIALPIQLLTQLVRSSDKATHDFLTWYLNSTVDLYKKAQESLHTRITDAKGAVASPLEFVRKLLSGHAWPSPAADKEEVEELRRHVEKLQSQLKQTKARGRPAPKRKRTDR